MSVNLARWNCVIITRYGRTFLHSMYSLFSHRNLLLSFLLSFHFNILKCVFRVMIYFWTCLKRSIDKWRWELWYFNYLFCFLTATMTGRSWWHVCIYSYRFFRWSHWMWNVSWWMPPYYFQSPPLLSRASSFQNDWRVVKWNILRG